MLLHRILNLLNSLLNQSFGHARLWQAFVCCIMWAHKGGLCVQSCDKAREGLRHLQRTMTDSIAEACSDRPSASSELFVWLSGQTVSGFDRRPLCVWYLSLRWVGDTEYLKEQYMLKHSHSNVYVCPFSFLHAKVTPTKTSKEAKATPDASKEQVIQRIHIHEILLYYNVL